MGKRLACLLAAIGVLAALLATDVRADPAADALAELTELSRLAEQTTEQMHSAQIDLDEKLSAQLVAENEAAADRVAVDATSADLAKYQAAVDKLAAAAYMGGRTDTLAAALTATSPQELIEQLAIQKTVASELTVQMAAFRSASARAATAADRSAKSAVQARTGPMRPRQCEPTLRPNSVECRSRLLRRYRSGCVRLLRVDQVGVPAEREVVAPVESGACSGRAVGGHL